MSRQLALQLDARRRDIDEELDALMSVLRSHNATLTSPLVDDEGFPRADIDIHAIRIARNRIAHLRNDRLAVTEQMADAMRQAFVEPRDAHSAALPNGNHADAASIASSSSIAGSASSTAQLKPFARINSVARGSPADTANLREGDLVLSFAGLAWSSSSSSSSSGNDDGDASTNTAPPSLSALPPLVREGQTIEVIVSRGGDTVHLQLTPQSGPGHRGLLGCHLLPI